MVLACLPSLLGLPSQHFSVYGVRKKNLSKGYKTLSVPILLLGLRQRWLPCPLIHLRKLLIQVNFIANLTQWTNKVFICIFGSYALRKMYRQHAFVCQLNIFLLCMWERGSNEASWWHTNKLFETTTTEWKRQTSKSMDWLFDLPFLCF